MMNSTQWFGLTDKMKTLIIHPTDITTKFLNVIYSGKDWTVITENVSKSYLKSQIREHDRIVMLGHGTEKGLIGFGRFIIDSSWVWLLRTKECVCIWCNADKFVEEYGLRGFYTGMIISEVEEAEMYSLWMSTMKNIEDSNILFSESVKNSIDSTSMLEDMKKSYHSDDNPIIRFNQDNLYYKL